MMVALRVVLVMIVLLMLKRVVGRNRTRSLPIAARPWQWSNL
jgi:hypothetical protein